MDARFWDETYGGRDQVFSGAPNGVLVTEVAELRAGQTLDVGCGEGADALWLARRGWQVTAVDISVAALRRAAAAATDTADLRHQHRIDPSDYYQPDDVAGLLDRDWSVLINETRPRTAPTPAGTHHTHDTVLRARRLR
jgi:SAM-dependent methyltransferase